ncbi:MAG: hypothetical protein IPH61_09365 [Bacteroidetes bacterium]|nr:hypothetical protein [Bacteroidota bacterium]
MKKSALISMLLVCFALTLGACTKCTVCTTFDLTTGEEIVEEYCGTGTQVTDFEKEWSINYDTLGGYCARK